jgi:hypothetical protein
MPFQDSEIQLPIHKLVERLLLRIPGLNTKSLSSAFAENLFDEEFFVLKDNDIAAMLGAASLE